MYVFLYCCLDIANLASRYMPLMLDLEDSLLQSMQWYSTAEVILLLQAVRPSRVCSWESIHLIMFFRRRWKGLDLGCCSPETQAHSRGFWPSLGSDHLPYLARRSTGQTTGCTRFWYSSWLHCHVQAIPNWSEYTFLNACMSAEILRVQWLNFRPFEYLMPVTPLRPLNMIHSNADSSFPASMVTISYMK